MINPRIHMQTTTKTIKPMKPIVNRTFRCYETRGGTPRIVTVTYEYNRDKKLLKYGASIYKQEGKKTERPFSKFGHRSTALGRLARRPVIVESINDSGNITEFNKMIRKLVSKNGVCGDQRIKDGTSPIASQQETPIVA